MAVVALALIATPALGHSETGLDTGARAPAFTLQGHDGRSHSLGDLLARGTTALVFYRSADW